MLNLYDIYEELLTEAKAKDIRGIIEFAIENNTSIRILYKGEKEKVAGWRLVEPYLIGEYMGKEKNLALRALQLTRTTSLTPDGDGKDPLKSLPKGWRVFRLDRILDVKAGTGKFQPRKAPKYNTNDKGMSKVYMGVKDTNQRVGDLYFKNN